MDVLRPPTTWIDGICYRKNPKSLISFKTDEDDENAITADEFTSSAAGYDEDEVCDAGLDIVQTAQGYQISMRIHSAYFKFLIGQRGQTKKRLEMETRTQVKIPRQGVEGDVIVIGAERRGVVSARTRIMLLVDSAKKKMPFTHFISFPLNARSVQDAFADFKADVLRDCDDERGVDFSLFQHPAKIHLTIGTLVLLDDSQIDEARQALEWCKREIIEPLVGGEGLRIAMRGLEYMNDDPSEVDVLYGQIQMADGTDKLQMIADRIVDHFCSQNLMTQQYDRVKIHATVMNTLFRRDPSGTDAPMLRGGGGGGGGGGGNAANDDQRRTVRKDRESFDAQKIFRSFGDYDFGDHVIAEVHLSARYSTGPDGYYLPAAKLLL